MAKVLDPALDVDVSSFKHWNENLLDRLIRERRQMPKAERLAKFRNDSVDEVDTTDLEKWSFAPPELVESEASEPEDDFVENLGYIDDLTPQSTLTEKYLKDQDRRLAVRHRLDMAKLVLDKDGGYSLRKFKRMFKREMEENPELYTMAEPSDQEIEV